MALLFKCATVEDLSGLCDTIFFYYDPMSS